jgi:hypothetical protein
MSTESGEVATDPEPVVGCSHCFRDQGLRLDAQQIGDVHDESPCPLCGSPDASKLTKRALFSLAHRFFVWGSLQKMAYGAAPLIQFNDRRSSDIAFPGPLNDDMHLLERVLGIGFFRYGPRMWMVGEVEPLKALLDQTTRPQIVERILRDYPSVELTSEDFFYRVRRSPASPAEHGEFDSPPTEYLGRGRLDSTDLPVLYGSPDIHVCLHECRVTAEDDLFVATLAPTSKLRLLNLAAILDEEVTEFDSLDLAVHMLFLAGDYSYPIARGIARSARDAGYDGLVYPSYFSMLRTGTLPFETAYGLSTRRFKGHRPHEEKKIVPNVGLFGRPIEKTGVRVLGINRMVLNRVEYGFHFGPMVFS